MDHQSNDDDWELCKENVKPLRQGRSFADMSMALQSSNTAKIAEQQELFERELRTYTGIDPLDIWIRYINWTEQNFPKGGSNVEELIKNCVLYFKDYPQYKNDRRYILIWIKFANTTTEPDEMFSYLFNQNFGSKVAELYLAWASLLEQVNNTTKADMVYLKGIEMAAEPIDLLRKQHQEFQFRVARRVASSEDEPVSASYLPSDDQNASRNTLGEIRSRGKHGHVPVNRVSAARSSVGGISTSTGTASQHRQSSRNAQIKIFTDENVATSEIPEPNKEYASVPLPGAENVQKPGKWTDASMKQRTGSRTTSSSHSSAAAIVATSATVPIFQDVNLDPPINVPHRITEPSNVLSARRETDSGANEAATLFASRDVASNQKLMYCHDKLYAGNKEYCFDELRKWRWLAKKKEQEEQQRKVDQLVHERVALLKVEIELDKQMYDILNVYRRNMQEQMTALLQNQLHVIQPAAANSITRPPVSVVDQPIVRPCIDEPEPMIVGKSEPEFLPPKMITDLTLCDASRLPDSPSHMFLGENANKPVSSTESVLFRQSENASSAITIFSQNANISSHSQVASGSNVAASVSTKLTIFHDDDSDHVTTNQSSVKYEKHTVTAVPSFPSNHVAEASMTVNSKEAYKMIMGMFNHTISADGYQGHVPPEEDSAFEQQFALTSATSVPTVTPLPITIYDETKAKQAVVPTSLGFQIFTENETSRFENPKEVGFSNKKCPLLSVRPESVKEPPAQPDKENYISVDNVPPVVFHSNVESRGIAEPAATFAHLVMSSNAGADDIEMKDENADWDCGEMTFNPRISSTQVFNGVVPFRTPFCTSSTTRLPPNGDAFTFYEDNLGNTNKVTDAMATTLAAGNIEHTASLPRGRMSSIFCGATSKLNTILEGSDDSKSKGSSMGSSRYPSSSGSGGLTGMTPSCGKTTHNCTSATTPGDALSTCHVSVHEASVAKNSVVHSHASERLHAECSEEEAVKEFLKEELNATMHHVNDVTQYVVKPSVLNEIDLNHSIAIDPCNPFDDATIEKLLSSLRIPISCYPNYHFINGSLPKFCKSKASELGGVMYTVNFKLGEGAYAKVYQISVDEMTLEFGLQEGKVVKVQQPSCPWEFYVTTELNRRLKASKFGINMVPSYMYVDEGFFFNDGSCLVYSYHKFGTLLDFVNVFKRIQILIPEWFVAYLAVELIDIVDYMHRCKIIHGDLKPDNILIRKLDYIQDIDEALTTRSAGSFLKLIDFGQSIDMNLFPAGTTFTAKVTTKGFQCTEMQTDRPWTYQTDLYGLVGTIHVLLFGSYMNVFYSGGMWRVTTNFKRGCHDVWKRLFTDLLNIPGCSMIPDLSIYRNELASLSKSLYAFNPAEFADFINNLEIAFMKHSSK